MSSNLNLLLAAWALSLVILVGGGLFLEVTHEAAPMHAPMADPDTDSDISPAPTTMADDGMVGDSRVDDRATDDMPRTQDAPLTAAPETMSPQTSVPDDTAETVTVKTPDSAPESDGPSQSVQDTAPASGTARKDSAGSTAPSPESAPVSRRRYPQPPNRSDPELLEEAPEGLLPRISRDGRMPAEVYAARGPSAGDSRPRIALMISELGLRSRVTQRAIADLPAPVALAFSPYGSNLDDWGRRAREMGHEIFIMVPMEPVNYPRDDPGPLALLVEQTAQQNISLLRSSLAQMTGYAGVVNHMGSRFTAASDSLRPILEDIKKRGLMFVDSRASQYSRAARMADALSMAVAVNNRYVDNSISSEDIAAQLQQLENQARTAGAAMGIGRPYPVTLEAVKLWAAGLSERGFVLVPVTAIANRQPLQ